MSCVALSLKNVTTKQQGHVIDKEDQRHGSFNLVFSQI